ncbi:hypothetical protein [Caballeronia sp. AZ10_KS36]|uniref:hypothetical protein n=1 Tax=Caballeronia sp. AZ10_KS36 TaxID=2921757 RepID=UPI002027E6EA|nr:hypothetical protein [Caballeronia sp. AZ10_KS36]
MTKLRTQWFPCTIPPVRPGLYECRYHGGSPIFMFEWTGKQWQYEGANRTPFGNQMLFRGGDKWRGLIKEAAQEKAK